ncbi:hypothetical protein CF319_g3121 [Tilletia indica]|nr:hypothetical protein CF319_g3121 [Tilletia indica]
MPHVSDRTIALADLEALTLCRLQHHLEDMCEADDDIISEDEVEEKIETSLVAACAIIDSFTAAAAERYLNPRVPVQRQGPTLLTRLRQYEEVKDRARFRSLVRMEQAAFLALCSIL